ncbi:MAG: beta-lactamase family protein [Bacteroidetes bacterium]|nr:beta-lactamase family protein [Bacteroidota bacterium]MBL7104290.1 beta-lactamase family protein [Bacteroidales bacterium]
MIKRAFYILSIILVSYFIFISGKKKSETEPLNFTAPESFYFNINDILSEQKAGKFDSIFKRLNKKGVFNGTVIYGERGCEVFKGAYGYADFRKKDTLLVQSAFQLASVSKMFTAMAIMKLQQDGNLNYDDTITKFISDFPYTEVTIRQLLNHRSGLSRYMSLADKYWNINKPINNEDVVKLFVKYKPAPYFKPDNGFHYCNTNYVLLASVVERITGVTFDKFVLENIFKPLGMDNSFVYNLNNDSVLPRIIPVGVPGYKYGGRYARKMGNYYLNGVMGDKGIYSTVEDMFKFDQALNNGILVSLSTLSEAFTRGSPKYWRRKDNYGFGWRIKEDADSTAYHFGWWKGFRSFYIRDMKNDRVIIALTNTHNGFSSEVLWDIVEDDLNKEELLSVYNKLKPNPMNIQ